MMNEANGFLYIDTSSNGWTTRVSLGFNRLFDFFDIKDGISIGAEAFYNGGGYSNSVFQDTTSYQFRGPVTYVIPHLGPVTRVSGTRAEFLLDNNLYQPNYLSHYYAAVFTGINRFLLSDMTLNLNGLVNLEQGSGVISLSFGYTTLSNLTFGITADAYLGGNNTEYTYMNSAWDTRISLGVAF
jgi:hypothetical protein